MKTIALAIVRFAFAAFDEKQFLDAILGTFARLFGESELIAATLDRLNRRVSRAVDHFEDLGYTGKLLKQLVVQTLEDYSEESPLVKKALAVRRSDYMSRVLQGLEPKDLLTAATPIETQIRTVAYGVAKTLNNAVAEGTPALDPEHG